MSVLTVVEQGAGGISVGRALVSVDRVGRSACIMIGETPVARAKGSKMLTQR